MSIDLATVNALTKSRLESNEVLALSCPLLNDEERLRIPRPTHAFLHRSSAFFSAIQASPQIAAFAGIDATAISEKVAAMQAIDAALIQNNREAQLLRDARLVLSGEAWTAGLKAYRLAVVLQEDNEAARTVVKEMGQLFTISRKKKGEEGQDTEDSAAADPEAMASAETKVA